MTKTVDKAFATRALDEALALLADIRGGMIPAMTDGAEQRVDDVSHRLRVLRAQVTGEVPE